MDKTPGARLDDMYPAGQKIFGEFIKEKSKWILHQNTSISPLTLQYNRNKRKITNRTPPKGSMPCDVNVIGRISTYRQIAIQTDAKVKRQKETTFRRHTRALQKHEQRLLNNVVITESSENKLRRHQSLGLRLSIAVDGSMESDSRCSFAWTLKTHSKKKAILPAACSGPVDRDNSQNSSTRAELFGLA